MMKGVDMSQNLIKMECCRTRVAFDTATSGSLLQLATGFCYNSR